MNSQNVIQNKTYRKYTRRKKTKKNEHDQKKIAEKCSFMKIFLTAYSVRIYVCVVPETESINICFRFRNVLLGCGCYIYACASPFSCSHFMIMKKREERMNQRTPHKSSGMLSFMVIEKGKSLANSTINWL